ncbi:MAG TPA: NADPH-dependent F420 reductase [Candidatus Acidoferrum sp.]|nr:NADPH-dependent F420 reductase [Candidatus Acidoferrum sp.]
MNKRIQSRSRRDVLKLGGAAALVASLPLSVQAAAAPLKIATIGAGKMGSELGKLWAKAGHKIMFSTRHPEELKELVNGVGANASAGTVADAVAFGDVVVLLVPYGAMPDLAKEHGKALASKALLLDVSNPIVPRDGDVGTQAREMGAGLYLAKLIPGGKIVRAFNAIGFNTLAPNSNRAGDLVGVPICGDDAGAVALASSLIKEIGYEPVSVGGLAMGKQLIPGTPLSGVHTAAEIRQIATTLK